MINSLSYLGISTPSYREWEIFGPQVLGMQLAAHGRDQDKSVRLRMDEACWRLALHPGESEGVAYVGWEVANEAAAGAIADAVASRGIDVHRSTSDLDEARGVAGLIWFEDPFGIRQELSWGRLVHPSTFVAGRAMSGFKTGAQGMGHVVFLVPSLAEANDFYCGTMGFQLSDHIIDGPINVRFYHVNGRHHSLAFAEAPMVGLHHLMVETNSLDDVGIAQDLCADGGVPITRMLGRHTNDLMTSFYLRTPSGFDIEYGWGALEVDDLWIPKTFHRTSIWGHHEAADAVQHVSDVPTVMAEA